MRKHTTHFYDCGCRSERLNKEIDFFRSRLAEAEKEKREEFLRGARVMREKAAKIVEDVTIENRWETAKAIREIRVEDIR